MSARLFQVADDQIGFADLWRELMIGYHGLRVRMALRSGRIGVYVVHRIHQHHYEARRRLPMIWLLAGQGEVHP